MKDLDYLYEDNHLVVINKPNGYLVHGDRTGDTSLEEIVMDYVREKYQKPGNVFLHSCHRLDRPVSGVLIFAKTSKGRDRMRIVFEKHQAEKTYLALVTNPPTPSEGDLTHLMLKDRSKNIVEILRKPVKGAVEARTKYRTLGQIGQYFLIELKPVTGKSHQLRVHMQHVGSSIVGDVKYGGVSIDDPSSIMLHCHRISFEHPIKREPLTLTADLPDHPIWNRCREDIFRLTELHY